ncbi:MAG: glycoside hydrolase family 95 protein [Lachnospiraceae bacterium]|nr:glycoside hydrolase family 95 protein [Lachnospiraceae bacterium]
MNDCLIMKRPASWHRDLYREGAPTGNGRIGALVYGGIAYETIAVNHSGLWGKGKQQELPDIHESLAETRKLLDAGEYQKANWVSANALKDKGYMPKLGAPCPLCDIRMEMKNHYLFQHYRRIVHMDSGVVTVSYDEEDGSIKRELFISRADDHAYYRISTKQKKVSLTLWLDLHETYEDDAKKKRVALEEENQVHSGCEQGMTVFYARHDDGTYYGATAGIYCDGKVTESEDGHILVEDASEVLVIASVFIHKTSEEVQKWMEDQRQAYYKMQQELQEKLSITKRYEEALLLHKAMHEKLYRRSELSLGQDEEAIKEREDASDERTTKEREEVSDEELLDCAYEEITPCKLLERQWKFGRYLMICGTSEDGLPFPLYGLWHGRYSMPWPHHMANENIEMIYWHTLQGGLFYSMKGMIHYYFKRMHYFRECAGKLFGLPGIFMPAGTTPNNALPNQIVPVIMNWISAAGWICGQFYQYYEYTGDEETLREEILPFMEEAAVFYQNYLVKDANGDYKIYPSVSPENTPKNLIPKGHEDMPHPCPSVVNATMDIAVIKELMSHLIELTKTKPEYQEKRREWDELIKHLPKYEMTEDGDIKEWQYKGLEQRYNHRHLSHIYPVFPGNELIKGIDDEKLLNGFEKAVDKRELGAQTGWSLAHMACIYARFQRAEKAINCLDILSKSCLLPNLFTVHNDWRGMGLTLGKGSFAPIQLDAAMGVVQAINEMILYSGKEVLKLLPAIPKRFISGKVTSMFFMAGTISMKWNQVKKEFSAEIIPNKDTTVTLFIPPFIQMLASNGIKIRNGEKIELKKGEVIILKQMEGA